MGEAPPQADTPAKSSGSSKLSQTDSQLLYGLSALLCAKCRRDLFGRSHAERKIYNLGERAHIVGESDDGPRGDPTMSAAERGSLDNHVLLCGTCHTEIDTSKADWPVERVTEMRETHYAWVREKLGKGDVDPVKLVYANLIDKAVELVGLGAWSGWTHPMLHPPLSWRPYQVDEVAEFAQLIVVTDWPGGMPELEAAISRLAYLLGRAQESFMARAEPRGEADFHVYRNYKRSWNDNYQRDHEEFTEWLRGYEGTLFEATAAANWVRSIWRAADNPDFLPEEHLALVTVADVNNRHHYFIEKYSNAEKQALLAVGPEAVDTVPTRRLDAPADDGLERLVAELYEKVLGARPAEDVLTEISDRIRRIEGRTDSAELFGGLPGAAIPAERAKRLSYELMREGVLERNPDTVARGFVLGELPF